MKTHVAVVAILALPLGCGTVVGNPRKPTDGTPKPTAIVYTLPELSFDVGDAGAEADPSALALRDDAALVEDAPTAEGDRTVLRGWSRRLDKIVAQINALSTRVTKIAAQEREANDDDVLTFSGKGGDGRLSGRLEPLAGDATYAYRAVLCRDEAPFMELKWSADGKRVSLVRDFSAPSAADVETFALRSAIEATEDDVLKLSIRTEGEWSDDAASTAGYLVEASEATRDASGVIELRAVSDFGTAKPDPFDGGAYLVGRLSPVAGPAGEGSRRKMSQAFVGYDRRFSERCGAGFDEAAADLWHPDGDGPRFCLGRPAGAKRFGSVAGFHATLADLQPIGIQPKAALAPVALPAGLSCAR
jgi:hypothetical protein